MSSYIQKLHIASLNRIIQSLPSSQIFLKILPGGKTFSLGQSELQLTEISFPLRLRPNADTVSVDSGQRSVIHVSQLMSVRRNISYTQTEVEFAGVCTVQDQHSKQEERFCKKIKINK